MDIRRENILKYLLVPLASLSLFFNPVNSNAETTEKRVIYGKGNYDVTIDTDRKEYSISPEVSSIFPGAKEKAEREILASAWLGASAESAEKKDKDLEETIDEIVWNNPSKIHFRFNDTDIPLAKNLGTYGHFQKPHVKIEEVWRKGNKLNLEFRLESQNYVFDWYKNCSMVFLHEKEVNLFRAIFDKIFVIDPGKPAKFGNFEEHELKYNEELEVAGMLNEAIMEKAIRLLPKINGMPHIAQACYEFENWLAKQERKSREEAINSLKSNYKLIRYTPSYWAASGSDICETGRRIVLQFEGKPKTIYALANINTKLNPLKEGQRIKEATQTELQEIYNPSLLKVLRLRPEQIENKGAIGAIITASQDIANNMKEILKEYEHKKNNKKFDLEAKKEFYEKLSRQDAQLWPWITFLNRILDQDIKGHLDDMPEYKRFLHESAAIQKAVRSLNEIINEYDSTGSYLPYLSSPRTTFETYKKAMQEKDWKMRDKTTFETGKFRWEANLEKDDGYSKDVAAEIEMYMDYWKFIKEVPYTGTMHKDFINRNTVEAKAFIHDGIYTVPFTRTKEGWKMDRAGQSGPVLLRTVYSIFNEIDKNKEMQQRIISNDISNDSQKPSVLPAYFSNFNKLKVFEQGGRLCIGKALECFACPLEFNVKKTADRIIVYHYGPDNKDDNGLIEYSPETGIGDISASFEK